jgi:hypothetical protein
MFFFNKSEHWYVRHNNGRNSKKGTERVKKNVVVPDVPVF